MKQETVHLFVFDSMSDWEYSYAAVGIHDPMFQAQPGRWRLRTVGIEKSPVRQMYLRDTGRLFARETRRLVQAV